MMERSDPIPDPEWPDLSPDELLRIASRNRIIDTGALDLERGALTNAGDLRRALDDLLAMAGDPDPVFRRRLAQTEADVEVAKLMGYQAASMLEGGRIPTVEVSVEKIFTSELRQRIADLAIDLLGPDGLRIGNSFERLYRVSPLMRFGGGTNEGQDVHPAQHALDPSAYDGAGRMRLRHDAAPGIDEAARFSYDSLYQLRRETPASVPLFNADTLAPTAAIPADPIPNRQAQIDQIIGPLSDTDGGATFDYDLAGNRLRERADGGQVTDYGVDALDEYQSRGGATLRYDPNGNLIGDGARSGEDRVITDREDSNLGTPMKPEAESLSLAKILGGECIVRKHGPFATESFQHLALRGDVDVEVRHVVDKVEGRAAVVSHRQRLAVVFDLENHR